MSSEQHELAEQVEQVYEDFSEKLDAALEDSVKEIRELARAVFDGNATEEQRKEYEDSIKELLNLWVSLVTGIFHDNAVHPVAPVAVEFYTVLDTHRLLADMPPKSPEILSQLQEAGVIGEQESDDNK